MWIGGVIFSILLLHIICFGIKHLNDPTKADKYEDDIEVVTYNKNAKEDMTTIRRIKKND